LDLARGHAEASNLTLVGYYQASERLDDISLYPVGERVATMIRENFPNAVALVLDARKIGADDPALVPYLPTNADPKAWRPAPPVARDSSPVHLVDPSSPTRALASVRDDSLHQKFSDFDDHLENVRLDWLRNRDVETYLQK